MKKLLPLCLLITAFIFSGCSKAPGKTDAKLKLSYSGISALMSTHGLGGAILFGKSSTGETFGKILNDVEETLVLNNGSWIFYAVMWENGASNQKLNGQARCGKSPGQLSGGDVVISMSLDNNTCADTEFSGGSFFEVAGKKKFANQFVEECDDITATTSSICGAGNQGSALSYRFVFNNFKKLPGGALSLESEKITSACKPYADLHTGGLDINFPSGNGSMPFVGTIEMFLGSSVCDENDPKGVFRFTLNQGARNQNLVNHKIFESNQTCSTYTLGSTNLKNKCEAIFGNFIGPSSCNTAAILNVFSRFLPAGDCTKISVPEIALKHLVSIPRSFLCSRYVNNSNVIGSNSFAGGDGSQMRNYKICTEWQLNQIGESNTLASLSNNHYKLMSDLDMNKTDIGTDYERPLCAGAIGSILEEHHNLNPLGKINPSGYCGTIAAPIPFTGVFNGNNKTISNARIFAKTASSLGFIRVLGVNGEVKNLNFRNLEVRGMSSVGGVVGNIPASTRNEINNIKIYKGDIEGDEENLFGENIGGLVGSVNSASSTINLVQARDLKLRGRKNVGGLVGYNAGEIKQSMFRGVIRNHYSSATSTAEFLGGLVGFNNGFVIESFSEGAIASVGNYIGGIIGKSTTVADNVQNIYSTMVVSSTNQDNPYVGGLHGWGDLKSGYFDGMVSASSTQKHNLFQGSGLSHNVKLVNASSTPGSLDKNYASLRSNYGSVMHPAESAKWSFLSGLLPRLAWENRECYAGAGAYPILNQRNAGFGSFANPILICNANQFSSLKTESNSSEFYKISDDINLSSWDYSSLISSFSGTLDGGQHVLYGLSLSLDDSGSESVNENTGIIKINNGNIKNILLIGNSLLNNDLNDLSNGQLVGLNNNEIRNIKIRGGNLKGTLNVGGVAGLNSGLIDNISIESTSISGKSNIGGIAGQNMSEKTISRASVNVKINGYGSIPYSIIGGIVGSNSGIVTQTRMSGILDFPFLNGSVLSMGGLVGENISSGTVSNSYVDEDNYINTYSNVSSMVGGLVGNNNGGTVTNSFHLGNIVYFGALPDTSSLIHATIGNGNDGTNLLYLKNSTYNVSAMNPYSYPAVGGSLNIALAEFSNFATFDSPEWDIAHIPSTGDGIRKNEVFNYYRSIMDGRIPPANSPIWVLEDGDDHPTLLQVD